MLEWVTPESWAAFVEMRRRSKAPLTPYAEKLIVRELVKLKTAGHDPQTCLDQSIMLGWRDVFPPRDKGLNDARRVDTWEPTRPMTEQERAASAAAKRAALGAVRVVK